MGSLITVRYGWHEVYRLSSLSDAPLELLVVLQFYNLDMHTTYSSFMSLLSVGNESLITSHGYTSIRLSNKKMFS